MKKLIIHFFIAATFFSFGTLTAHPGIGIVMDSKGNVFFTDLEHVWKITPDGDLTIAVKDVHTHELYLDNDDNLYGEHVWYNGEATDTWGHYVWCLSDSGVLEQTIPPTEGFPVNNTLARDSSGKTFWAEQSGEHEILKEQSGSGKVSIYSEHKFDDIRWIIARRSGANVWVVDHLGVKQIDSDGNVQVLAENLRESGRAFGGVRDMHYLMGIWPGEDNSVYVAAYGAKKVIRLNTDGKTETVYESPRFWSPCGGFISPDGSLWLMEFSSRNRTRVKKINKDGNEVIFRK